MSIHGSGYLKLQIDEREAEIARLQELLRGTGANRYWEGRWRDAEAENQRLRAALEEIKATTQEGLVYEICHLALAKEGK